METAATGAKPKPTFIRDFVIKALALYLLWLGAEHFGLTAPLHSLLTEFTAWSSVQLMGLVSPDTHYYFRGTQCLLQFGGSNVLLIDNPCNGLTIMLLYIGFLVAYPGTWKSKLVFISLGTMLVYLMNVVRVILLSANFAIHKVSFEFNHKYTFTFAVYVVVFMLWVTWANKYSLVSKASA
jgi:exosortase family protein XrtF